MRKSDVISHFGTQQKVADALTAAGFPISQRGVSGWADPIPLARAYQVQSVTNGKRRVDLALYRDGEQREGRAQ